MTDTTGILIGFGVFVTLIVGGVGYLFWSLHRESRGLERFARSMAQMKRDAEASGGNIKTEATAFKDVFKP